MSNDTLRNTFINFLVIGLFMVLTITIVYQMGINYNVNEVKLNQATAGSFDMDEYRAELNISDLATENYRERYESGEIVDVDNPTGIFSIGGDMVNLITTPYKILMEIGINILHFPKILVITILSILNISLIFGLVSLIRKGD